MHKEYHADHIIPITKGGSSWKENYQMLCPSCNHKKNARLPWDYEELIGFERNINFWDNTKLYSHTEYRLSLDK